MQGVKVEKLYGTQKCSKRAFPKSKNPMPGHRSVCAVSRILQCPPKLKSYAPISSAYFSTHIDVNHPMLVIVGFSQSINQFNSIRFRGVYMYNNKQIIWDYYIYLQVRDYIHAALYDPDHGYFSKRSGSVGVLDTSIKFNHLQGLLILHIL